MNLLKILRSFMYSGSGWVLDLSSDVRKRRHYQRALSSLTSVSLFNPLGKSRGRFSILNEIGKKRILSDARGSFLLALKSVLSCGRGPVRNPKNAEKPY